MGNEKDFITVAEARKLKKILERDLEEKIRVFNEQTGLKIETMYLDYVSTGSMENPDLERLNAVKICVEFI